MRKGYTNMISPKVSIIIPVYNAEKWLPRCLDSLLNQSFKDFELILVDDGSTDGSGIICDSYSNSDNRVRVIHKSNGGVSSARNVALDLAEGEYITFCDADDEVLSDWLEDFIKEIGEADLCMQGFTGVDINGQNPNHRIPRPHIWYNLPEFLGYIMEAALLGFSPTKLFKNAIIKKYDLRFDETIRWREDDLFVVNYLAHAYSCVSIDKSNYIYYVPAECKNYGMTSTAVTEKLGDAILTVCNGKPSRQICHAQAWSFKGYAVSSLIAGDRLSDHFLELYKIFVIDGLPSHSRKEKIINTIVAMSGRHCRLAKFILRGIHTVS